jgi:hypothetical protein
MRLGGEVASSSLPEKNPRRKPNRVFGLASKKWTWIQAAVMSFFVGWFSKATGER